MCYLSNNLLTAFFCFATTGIECEIGTSQPKHNKSICESCPLHTTTKGKGATECVCVAQRFDQNGTCRPCPEGGDCSAAGTTIASIELLVNTWRTTNQTATLYTCPINNTCVGGDGKNGSFCAEGHRGVLCASCDAGWYRRQKGQRCHKCRTFSDTVRVSKPPPYHLYAPEVIGHQK